MSNTERSSRPSSPPLTTHNDDDSLIVHQTSGEDTDGNDSPFRSTAAHHFGSEGRGHSHTQSWSATTTPESQGAVAVPYGSFTGFGSSPIHRPPLPTPPMVRRHHSAERGDNNNNNRFLARGSRSSNRIPSPSPRSAFRKQVLNAIEEDGQSLVIVDGDNSQTEISQQQDGARASIQTASSRGSHHSDSDYGSGFPRWYDNMDSSHHSNASFHHIGSIRLYQQQQMDHSNGDFDDEWSNVSSIAGSYTHGAATLHHVNNPYLHLTESERVVRFEREQEDRFQERKMDLERRLHDVLERSPSASHKEKNDFIQIYMQELEQERANLLAQWKAEMMAEHEGLGDPRSRLANDALDVCIKPILDCLFPFLATLEVMLSNMPITIGALGLGWVCMGVVWFKWTEEIVDSCQHVNYYSDACTFPEFPGCFQCDTTTKMYQVALASHNFCTMVAGICCVLFLAKVILAWNVVLDMLQNPTTSTPIGVASITMVCVFSGRGIIGEIIVLITSAFHFLLAFWFLYMAFVRYRLWPDPGWFPNTVGISYAAVKTWTYFPLPGIVLMALCLCFFLGKFFISVVRVALNNKIAAPLCWIQLSAPSITLYALSILSQPTPKEEGLLESSPEEQQHFHAVMKSYFLPLQHAFMLLALVGLASAIHSLWVRWDTFKTKEFSPAHVAFCFPTLSHANAVQAYRSSVNAYSTIPPDSLFKKILFVYWCIFLVGGTMLNIIFTYKYLVRIPKWTKLDVSGEEEPPVPSATFAHEMMDEAGAHETIVQPFVSPAVLEAQEAGVLVRVQRGTEEYRIHGPFKRTRKVTSLGFDLILNEMELRQERAELLDWVAKNAPRKRNRTLSIPGAFYSAGNDGSGMYGTFTDGGEGIRRGVHSRSRTSIDNTWG